MADTVERLIYKTEIDDSGYIKGIESMSASTKRFAEQQEAANKRLLENQAALKTLADIVEKDRKALENYAGTDTKFRKQLEDNLKSSQTQYAKVAELVATIQKNYDKANKSAQDFANTTERANKLQTQTTGGKIPVPGLATAPPVAPPVIPPVAFQDFDLKEILGANTIEFERLRAAIEEAEKALAGLDQESEEFKQLAPIVAKGREALTQYDAAAKLSGGSTLSLRSQLRLAREELVKMEQAGQGASKAYLDLEKRTAKLTDQFNDQQQRIRILASDTKLLDFGKASITAATSAFQTYASVSILVGDQSEELQKKTMQLFAAMQLLQSLEQLSNLTRREGVLATLAQSGAQSVYTAVVGTSTGALKAFRIALAATGIGLAIAAIAFLVIKLKQHADAVREAGKDQKILNDINKEAVKEYSNEVSKLELIRSKLNDLKIPQSERIKLAKDYNKTADEANKLDLTQINNIDLVNAAIDRQIKKLEQRAIARAAESVLGKKAEEFFTRQVEFEEQFPEFSDQRIKEINSRADQIVKARAKALQLPKGVKIDVNELTAFADLPKEQLEKMAESNEAFKILLDEKTRTTLSYIQKQKQNVESVRQGENNLGNQYGAGVHLAQERLKESKEDFDRTLRVVAGIINVADLIADPNKTKGEIENVFEQEKANLNAQLSELSRSAEETLKKINDEFADKLVKETLRIQKLVKAKKVTAAQGDILIDLAVKVNQTGLEKAISELNKKITAAREKLNDELRDLQNKNIQDQINLLQDEFERRKQLIDFNEKKEIEDAKEATQDRLDSLEFDRLLIGEQNYQDAKAQIISAGEQQALNIQQKYAIERQNLAADSFKKILQAYEDAIKGADLIRDEGIAKQIRNVSDRFLTGKISYERFQREITKIQRDYEAIRRDATLQSQRSELSALDRQIELIKDKTSKEYADLIKLREDLRTKIASGENDDAVKDVEDKKTPADERAGRIIKYSEAIGQLVDSVIQFWNKANEAESKALDRSISLQEKRVDAAQRIAERGNAQYLKAEQDRLTELQVKRENAARKQLGIDAALQASQILVGITGAIAKIATPGIGIAETISSIAIIVGALATGYGLVKSLQGNQPRLAKGTTYVKRNGHPSGVDTIPALLNEGEAVISTDKNKAYHPTVKAIHEGKIPAEALNNFVKTYHVIKPVPQVNYGRIKDAAELHIQSDGRMAVAINDQNKLIQENNDLQRQTLRAMKAMGVNVNMDRNGIAVSVMEVMDEIKINKKT
jgi:hypothetical protein